MKILRTGCLLFTILTLTGCCSISGKKPVPRPTPSEPSNVVAVAGPTLGSLELHTRKCISGERLVFRGAVLYDDTTKEHLELLLVFDPIAGPAVRILKGSEEAPSIILRSPDCRTFKYNLESTGRSVNSVTEVHVSLELDCRSKAGDYVVGKVEFPECL